MKRQGSFWKLLSANSRAETQFNMSLKMIDRPSTSQIDKDYHTFLQEYNILSEYNMLRTQDLKGIYVIPAAHNPFLWFGVQFIRQGIYQGGVFRFTITLPTTFPEGGCPVVIFQTKLFHPLINPESGELDTTWGFTNWKKSNKLWQLIQYITRVLTKIDSKMTPINQEASHLLKNDIEGFRERVKTCIKESLNQVYDAPTTKDPHYITFSPLDSELHDSIRQNIYKAKKDDDNKAVGYSWVQPGSLKPFSKSGAR